MSYRVLFLGTADFAVKPLEVLVSDSRFEVAAVVTQPDRPAGRKLQLQESPVKKFALTKNIEVLTPESVNTPEFLQQAKSLNCQVAVVVAYGQILKQSFLDCFANGAVNIHGSILPRWRGAAPIQRALMAGDVETGVSLQQIALKLDSGDVIAVKKQEITPDTDAVQLYQDLRAKAGELIAEDLFLYLEGDINPVKQDESLVTIADKIKKEEGLVDWNESAISIYHKYQGLKMWPGIWVIYEGKNLKLHDIKYIEANSEYKPGEVSQIEKEFFSIQCNLGQIQIFQLQPESRTKQSAKDFLNSRGLQVGQKF